MAPFLHSSPTQGRSFAPGTGGHFSLKAEVPCHRRQASTRTLFLKLGITHAPSSEAGTLECCAREKRFLRTKSSEAFLKGTVFFLLSFLPSFIPPSFPSFLSLSLSFFLFFWYKRQYFIPLFCFIF